MLSFKPKDYTQYKTNECRNFYFIVVLVHFEVNPEKKGLRIELVDIQKIQQRCLTDWTFAEHLQPHVLLQVFMSCFFYRNNDLGICKIQCISQYISRIQCISKLVQDQI